MDSYLEESFGNCNIQLFVGSGLSNGLYPNSQELLAKLLDDAIYIEGKLTTLREVLGNSADVSLEDAAEFYELYQGSNALIHLIKGLYGIPKRPIDIHEKLWKLPNVCWIYTTNFDSLIEDALCRPKQPPEVITRGADIREIKTTKRVVFKPHGCARKSTLRNEFVITRNDFLNYSHSRMLEMLKTLYDISTKVFLFIGYSLKDLNMRHILSEASRTGIVRSYAVFQDASGPEARYLKELGVTLIEQSVEEFVEEVLTSFPAYEFEWDEKIDERVDEKEEIANKALLKIKNTIQKNDSLNIIIDAGSSTLHLAKSLTREALQGTISLKNVRIVTNSPLVMDELMPAIGRSKGEAKTTIIGGPLRFSTRAYTPDEASAHNQLRSLSDSKVYTIAFMGATALDENGLKTKTKAELSIKHAFIGVADEVYILADHSKIRSLSKGYVFSVWDKNKMTIITDRVKAMREMAQFCKAIL
ncbi:MAG: SIR2 family protein [bacterium]